jgi:hypothetical protein
MTTFCLEMRSTQDWGDVRYREYTTSARKADLFKQVPKIRFTDSGHHIIPFVKETAGKRQPVIRHLREHVEDALRGIKREDRKSLAQKARDMRNSIDAMEIALMGWPELINLPKTWGEPRHRPGLGVKVPGTTAQVYRICDALAELTRIINSDEYRLND